MNRYKLLFPLLSGKRLQLKLEVISPSHTGSLGLLVKTQLAQQKERFTHALNLSQETKELWISCYIILLHILFLLLLLCV